MGRCPHGHTYVLLFSYFWQLQISSTIATPLPVMWSGGFLIYLSSQTHILCRQHVLHLSADTFDVFIFFSQWREKFLCTWFGVLNLAIFSLHVILNFEFGYFLQACSFELRILHPQSVTLCSPTSFVGFVLTHFSLASHKWDIGKQCRPRSDAAERGAWSWSTLFALSSDISIKHDNNKN